MYVCMYGLTTKRPVRTIIADTILFVHGTVSYDCYRQVCACAEANNIRIAQIVVAAATTTTTTTIISMVRI